MIETGIKRMPRAFFLDTILQVSSLPLIYELLLPTCSASITSDSVNAAEFRAGLAKKSSTDLPPRVRLINFQAPIASEKCNGLFRIGRLEGLKLEAAAKTPCAWCANSDL
jgi:hypothetical protein